MAKDVLHFLENRKENMSWVKSASAEMALQVSSIYLLWSYGFEQIFTEWIS